MKHALVCALALSLFAAPTLGHAQDATPKKKTARKLLLWKVTGKGLKKPAYLFGTIHVPDSRVLKLSKSVTDAIDGSDALYCELALEPSLQMAATKHMMLPKGKTLASVIGQDLVDRAAKVLAAKGLPIAPFQQLKPWAFISQLQMLDYIVELQTGKQPLDAMLYNRAKNAGKTVGGLEKIEDQMSVFNGISVEGQKKMVESGLDGMEKAAKEKRKASEPLVKLYLKGDLEAMLKMTKEESGDDAESKALMKRLLDDRNVNMAKEIDRLVQKNADKGYFFAVGAAHYAGKTGVGKLLEAEGYTVERIEK